MLPFSGIKRCVKEFGKVAVLPALTDAGSMLKSRAESCVGYGHFSDSVGQSCDYTMLKQEMQNISIRDLQQVYNDIIDYTLGSHLNAQQKDVCVQRQTWVLKMLGEEITKRTSK